MKKKLIIVFALFTIIGVGLFYLLTMGNIGVQYDTVEVVKGQAGMYVQDVGRISSQNIRSYYGNSLRKVVALPIALGDRVSKGDLLVRYEDDLSFDVEINMAIIDLNKEILALEIQKVEKQIKALEAVYKDAASGTDMESVNSARIEIARVQSQIDSAIKDYERTEALYNEGIVTAIELEQSDVLVGQLESSLSIAQNTYNQLAKGISDNMREKYEADIDAMVLSIDVLDKNIAILEKNKEEIKSTNEDNEVYADVEGIVTTLNTFEGDTPSAGVMILQLHDPTNKVILVDFMVEDALKVIPGQGADIQDDQLAITIEDLEVGMVYPTAFITLSELGVEENRQTVEIALGSSADELPFGLELEAKVMIAPERETLLVPSGAVVEYNGNQYVEVLEDGEVLERMITTGIRINGKIEVLEGVVEGEKVILNYQED